MLLEIYALLPFNMFILKVCIEKLCNSWENTKFRSELENLKRAVIQMTHSILFVIAYIC